jgi:glyoxylase-like metal-dependent hydrolase (beta-lactamase superfamily II)
MAAAAFRALSPHVDMFTPDERTDRPALGAIHGERATLLVEGGASVDHLRELLAELRRGRPPVTAIVLTHWHWDHSFGSAALDVPVIAHRDSADALAVQAQLEWSDEALDARVAAGEELAFCAEMMKLEIPDRSDLRIVVPSVIVEDEPLEIELGGVSAVIEHVGGDHAPDSLAVYVPADRAIFVGDCLYQRLHAPVEHLTIAGVRDLTERLARYDVEIAVEGHNDDVADGPGFAARLAELRLAADLVERHGAAAEAEAGDDEDLAELVGFLIEGERPPG